MKKILSTIFAYCLIISCFAQVKVNQGPELGNEEDNKMNRMIDGENGAFYSYRIRTKGKGTSYLVEKFDKASLKTVFSKEVDIPVEKTKVMDVEFVGGKVFVIYRSYDKEKEVMTVYYKTVSTDGTVSPAGSELLSRSTDHYEFIDFDIATNDSKS